MSMLTRDHPRACGAHIHLPSSAVDMSGSSPRMRGSLNPAFIIALSIGIIPAHAGLTGISPRLDLLAWDHPRACGAHKWYRLFIAKDMGSSPRMRGSLHNGRYGDIAIRIIPAHAGLTRHYRRRPEQCRDHPRACGAHGKRKAHKGYTWGSSPRMRGSLKSPETF